MSAPEPPKMRSDDEPGEALRLAIRASLLKDDPPIAKPRSLSARVSLVLGVVALAVGLAAPMVGKKKAYPPFADVVPPVVVAVLVLASSLVGAFSPSLDRRLSARGRHVMAWVLVATWLSYLVIAAHPIAWRGALEPAALVCWARALLSGGLAGGAAMWLFRRSDPWSPGLTGALIGASVGCVGAAAVGLGCPGAELGHLLVGHGLIVPLLMVAGFFVGRRALKP